jgi:ribosome maturation factor RimP
MFAFDKLPGLPRERIIDAIAPVLRAHGVSGVELIWRTDPQGRVLTVTLEPLTSEAGVTSEAAVASAATLEAGALEAGALEAGAETKAGVGVTLEVCSRVSRDLSTALDVLELIEGKYRLEVGSPGLERRLYTPADYTRFSGRSAKLKLALAVGGQYVISGKLGGIDADGRVLIAADGVDHAVKFEDIRSGQLAVDWQEMGFSPAPRHRAGKRSAAQGRK